jgi:hypothetical protein
LPSCPPCGPVFSQRRSRKLSTHCQERMPVTSRSLLSEEPAASASKWAQFPNPAGRSTAVTLPRPAAAFQNRPAGRHHPPALLRSRSPGSEAIPVEDQQVDQPIRIRETRRSVPRPHTRQRVHPALMQHDPRPVPIRIGQAKPVHETPPPAVSPARNAPSEVPTWTASPLGAANALETSAGGRIRGGEKGREDQHGGGSPEQDEGKTSHGEGGDRVGVGLSHRIATTDPSWQATVIWPWAMLMPAKMPGLGRATFHNGLPSARLTAKTVRPKT